MLKLDFAFDHKLDAINSLLGLSLGCGDRMCGNCPGSLVERLNEKMSHWCCIATDLQPTVRILFLSL